MDGAEDIKHPSILEVPFNGRLVKLSSPASARFRLQGIGPQTIAWEPEGKEAFEVELRARIQSNTAAGEDFPIVRWTTEVSAAGGVWEEPFTTRSSGAQHIAPIMPARGMVWRTGARQFRITFFADGTEASVALINADVEVTILPVWGTRVDTYPYQDANGRLETRSHIFPMTAREWRVQDIRGLPFAPGVNPMFLLGLNGSTFPGGFAEEYSEWQPIPFEAAAWASTDGGTYVAFR